MRRLKLRSHAKLRTRTTIRPMFAAEGITNEVLRIEDANCSMHSGRDDWSLGGACVAGVARESSEFCRELGGGADRYDRATSDAGARADHATTDRGGGATSSCTTRRIRAVERRGLHIDRDGSGCRRDAS